MAYRSNSSKYPSPNQLRKEKGVKFWVQHIHQGNDPTWERRMQYGTSAYCPIYVTTCEITDESGTILLGYGESLCNPKDSPNRRMGHEIAVTRAIKSFLKQESETEKDILQVLEQ